MPLSRRDFLKRTGTAIAASGLAGVLSWLPAAHASTLVTDDALHLLRRITWGPRPADVERARTIGPEAYLDEQLNPYAIDDSDVEARLQAYPILGLSRREALRLQEPEYRTYLALMQGMIVRATYSNRQLHERMVEFWLDHFNIPSDELGAELVVYHRDVVRANALGNFRDLLFGTAQNPAMLTYLDNYLNVAEHPNENYAREMLELHTLGVDGGYTETDVKEVARALTGWTINNATDTGFYFDLNTHDTDEKTFLGHTLPAGRGIEDGLHVLSIVANHPSTARFICHKLCVRFVSDDPPQTLIDSAADVWMTNDGEITPVLRHIFTSPEFQASRGEKLRRPLDFYIAALRATGTEILERSIHDDFVTELAQVPYGWKPPNGYPDVAEAWMSTNGLLARWNVAMSLTHRAMSETTTYMVSHLIERTGMPPTVGELVDTVALQVFATPLNDDARAAYIAYASDEQDADTPVTPHLQTRKLGTLYGLMIASPDFQWR